MNLKTQFTTIAAASIFALSLGTSALAENTVTQVITGGSLTASIADATLTPIAFSNEAGTSTGMLQVEVNDARGTDDGWSVTIQSTGGFSGTDDGINDVTGKTIPAAGFAITGYDGSPVASPVVATGAVQGTDTGVLTTAHTVMTAAGGGGTGIFTQGVNIELNIPAQTAVGTYVATVTVLTADAPI